MLVVIWLSKFGNLITHSLNRTGHYGNYRVIWCTVAISHKPFFFMHMLYCIMLYYQFLDYIFSYNVTICDNIFILSLPKKHFFNVFILFCIKTSWKYLGRNNMMVSWKTSIYLFSLIIWNIIDSVDILLSKSTIISNSNYHVVYHLIANNW